MSCIPSYHIPPNFKDHLLSWIDSFETGVLLDSNTQQGDRPAHSSWDLLAGVGVKSVLEVHDGLAFEQLKLFQSQNAGKWLFGYFSYDLKNELEELSSDNFDGLKWPPMLFFQPEIIVGIKDGRAMIYSDNKDTKTILNDILNTPIINETKQYPTIQLQPRISKQTYLQTINTIKNHIKRGDIYELNYCQEFYAHPSSLQPTELFKRLNKIAKAPFSGYLKQLDKTLLCASPERFLKKSGQQLISQPIKGTRRRDADLGKDAHIRTELVNNPKDRSENIMIVDLVRNDFAKNCIPGTVKVDELCQIYSFPTVHQMISTVSGTLPKGTNSIDAIKDAFPMGSMTGAPKVMAMKLIEAYEKTKRGLYSGALGYFDPNGDFDFNVVIRSLQYNSTENYLSCSVGGAIVYESDPAQEYEECLIKMAAIQSALSNNIPV
jgi:para-aminobenzoate synthetase component 1